MCFSNKNRVELQIEITRYVHAQLLQLVRDNGYTDVKLHDDIIEACVRESGSDVEQVNRSNLFTKNLFSFSTESRTRCIDSINQK